MLLVLKHKSEISRLNFLVFPAALTLFPLIYNDQKRLQTNLLHWAILFTDDLTHAITKGLGPDYLPFVRALEARRDDFSFDDLYGMLLSEELRLKKTEKGSETLNAAANFGIVPII